jgi:hypothetical protein
VESRQELVNQRLAQLQDQLGQQNASAQQQIAADRESAGRAVSELRGQVEQNRAGLDQLAQKVSHQKVGFEVTKNANVELVPGISLTVTHTDPSYQRLNGYLSLADDGRTIWLRSLGAQEAFSFYSKQGGQPYDLLVTSVTKNNVVGYLLVPADSAKAGGETAATNLTPQPSSEGSREARSF